jgi:hypothetical protein
MSDIRSLETLNLEYLRCRTFGHVWEEFVAVGKPKPITGFRLSLLCTSCRMERHDGIDTLGQVGTRQYVQPPGYKLGFKVKRNEARLVYNKRRRRQGMKKRQHLSAVG